MSTPTKFERLINQYKAYVGILQDRGIEYDPVNLEALHELSYPDLNALVKEARDLARTPSS